MRIAFGMPFSLCRLRPGSSLAIRVLETPHVDPSALAFSVNEDRGRGTRGYGGADNLDAQNLAFLREDEEIRQPGFIGTERPALRSRLRIEEMSKEGIVSGLLA